jgi:hypothetical protein
MLRKVPITLLVIAGLTLRRRPVLEVSNQRKCQVRQLEMADPGVDVQAKLLLVGKESASFATLRPDGVEPLLARLGHSAASTVRDVSACFCLDEGPCRKGPGSILRRELFAVRARATVERIGHMVVHGPS